MVIPILGVLLYFILPFSLNFFIFRPISCLLSYRCSWNPSQQRRIKDVSDYFVVDFPLDLCLIISCHGIDRR